MRGGRIFISYRRNDSRADSGRLYDRLSVSFPDRVFRDVASIEPGVEWDEAIAHVLSQTDACIVVIGQNWLTVTDDTGRRRLDDPQDIVRQELGAVLSRQMRVFPLLVGGAKMPQAEDLPEDLRPLCRRNAMELSEQHWDEGVQRLLQALETALKPDRQQQTRRSFSDRASAVRWPLVMAGLGILAVAALIWFILARKPVNPGEIPEARVVDASASLFTGNWRAVVTTATTRQDEDLQLFPDHSLRFVSENKTLALGNWRYNSGAHQVEVLNALDLTGKANYSCTWKEASPSHQTLAGTCMDSQSNSWNVSLSQAPGSVIDRSYSIPRINLSEFNTAQRAAYSALLSSWRCRCGMALLTCLRKHAACPDNLRLAQSARATFMRTAH